ncbi:hypothetical protein H8N03_14750 [Ramlibacter sp. USB13]|uniref:Uncharacterized protein n=1 Tax=Ramlibacter cellulosilyticus TaxID=2764187 RepID=A0A923SBT5_9BURK|nr:hypothetical protein [Ramlibacter cellulosilyticus]
MPLAAQALCTSDGVAQPGALLERFVSADCADCWRDRATPEPAAGSFAIDWVVPGTRGDDAPLAAVALDEATERLATLGRSAPQGSDAVFGRRQGAAVGLRLAQGDAFNDYIGTSIELKSAGRGPWQAWLLLVEQLPAGTEGSPVERHLVRNVFRPDWSQPAKGHADGRAMQIHDGAKPERLRLVAVLADSRGRIRAISRTACSG